MNFPTRRSLGAAMAIAAVFCLTAPSRPAGAATVTSGTLAADLDGSPIKLADVGNWYCDDFSYPLIHCFSDPRDLESRSQAVQAAAAVNYVTVYEYTGFAGSYMHMSQDYTALIWIGWSDRISSLKGRNSQTSRFYVDWYYAGAIYGVCCNVLLTSLGSWDNAFSSVHRN